MHKVIIDGVEYMPALKAERDTDGEYQLCSDILGQIAKRAAVEHWDRHEYMPTDVSHDWRAHGWVIHAMKLAIGADRVLREAPPASLPAAEEDARDAARWKAYRKYRATPQEELSPAWIAFLEGSIMTQDFLNGHATEPEHLDRAIDAAMSQDSKGEGND